MQWHFYRFFGMIMAETERGGKGYDETRHFTKNARKRPR